MIAIAQSILLIMALFPYLSSRLIIDFSGVLGQAI